MNPLGDITDQLRGLQEFAVKMAEVLRTGRMAELLVDGAAVVLRPVTFIQPRTGEVDPVFGLGYEDWKRFRLEEGFTGWQESKEGSAAPKVIIHTAEAEAWLRGRLDGQRGRRGAEGFVPRSQAVARERWEKRRRKVPQGA